MKFQGQDGTRAHAQVEKVKNKHEISLFSHLGEGRGGGCDGAGDLPATGGGGGLEVEGTHLRSGGTLDVRAGVEGNSRHFDCYGGIRRRQRGR